MRALKSLLEMPFSGRQRKLASTRLPISKTGFIEDSASTDLGKIAAAHLWQKLNGIKVDENFTPSPEDNLLSVYGLAEEDLDEDIILSIIREVGVGVPTKDTLEDFGPVHTPHDIIKLIERCEA